MLGKGWKFESRFQCFPVGGSVWGHAAPENFEN